MSGLTGSVVGQRATSTAPRLRRQPIDDEAQPRQRKHRPDYILLLLSSILLVIGLVVLYAISPGLAISQNVGNNYYVGKQLLAIALGVAAFALMANIPARSWLRFQRPLIAVAAGFALLTRVIGQQVNGAYRWIQVGGISFQSAELIKFALLIWAAAFLVQRKREGQLSDFRSTLVPLLICLAVIGVVVGVIQSDLGSTTVMVGMVAAMVFVIGMPLKKVLLAGAAVLIGVILLVSTSAYRRERLLTFTHPASNCQTTGYQVCQALIAVGSGGVAGLGLGNSVQAYGYLPEAANDSIFAILAEKFGFIGVSAIIVLFMAFFRRLVKIAEDAPDDYSRLLVVGILAWLVVQTLINVGAMLGLLPLKGITLPFISYGGTSLVFVMGAIGLVYQISSYTVYSRQGSELNTRGGERHESAAYRGRNRRPHHAAVSRRPEA